MDDDNYSSGDTITKTLSHQLAKSLNRAVAKTVKQKYNRVAKRLIPDRNNRKEHRKTKIGSALDNLEPIAEAIIKEDDLTEIKLLEQQVIDCHRGKNSTAPLSIMGAVVKVLTRRDIEWHTDAGKAALLKK